MNITTENIVGKLSLGWNLGNTFDAPEGETAWGNPVTSKELINYVKELGFGVIRIPVSWHKHTTDEPDYIIDSAFMQRVYEVVEYAILSGLYVILNSHHDDVMYQPTKEGESKAKQYLSSIWRQIAEKFAYFDEKLIFEGMNEPRIIHSELEWHLRLGEEVSDSAVELINQYSQVVVDTVRSVKKGNNGTRYIMAMPYDAGPHYSMIDGFRLPKDPSDRIILSVHSYTPYNLCLNEKSDVKVFTEEDKKEITGIMTGLYEKFISKGIPVIIGECGVMDKKNPDARYLWGEYFVSKARKYGIVPILWDNGGWEYKIIDRRNISVYPEAESVYEGIIKGTE